MLLRRYEDNGDSVTNFSVIVQKSDKGSIDGYGTPEKFLETVTYLFGKQAYSGMSGCPRSFFVWGGRFNSCCHGL